MQWFRLARPRRSPTTSPRNLSGFSVLLPALALLWPFSLSAFAESIPRVLILGDSVYQQPVSEMQKVLKGRVEIGYPRPEPGVVHNSGYLLEHLDALLGEAAWDLIHVNCGLGDLIYRAPGMNAFRVLPIPAGGVRTTPAPKYEENLRALAERLNATGAHIVWASTTPIRHSTTQVFEKGSEIEYNAIAAKVMTDKNIPINDMYTHVRALIDMDKPAGHGADPFFFDRKPIHEPILEQIVQHLNLPPAP